MEIDIAQNWAALSVQILVLTQGLKKLIERAPWILALVEKATGTPGISAGAAVALSAMVACAAGAVEIMADGQVSVSEVMTLIAAWVGASGGHGLVKAMAPTTITHFDDKVGGTD